MRTLNLNPKDNLQKADGGRPIPSLRTIYCLLLAAYCLLASVALVYGQAGGGYDLSWHSISAGGRNGASASTGGIYGLSSTIGQAVASNAKTGGIYGLTGGFQSLPASTPGPR